MRDVYVLGGKQTDFAQNWLKQGTTLTSAISDVVNQGFDHLAVPLDAVDSVVIGNFAGELFVQQGLMSGLVVQAVPEFYGLPSMRTEAACASGSMAIIHGMMQIQAGVADIVCVLGIEQMRNQSALDTAAFLGTAIHQGQECQDIAFPWPHLFGKLGEVYEERYGLNPDHLTYLSDLAFRNAALNPHAQTRLWDMPAEKLARDSDINPAIDGMIRRSDCAQVTDGAVMLILASEKAVKTLKTKPNTVSRISGVGHTTAPIGFDSKLNYAKDWVFPHIRSAVTQAYAQARIDSIDHIDLWETHDCFSTTFYMALDHLGITSPGENHQAIESGQLEIHGDTPVNPTGGLIGIGHPVGATGVRQMLDCHHQVTQQAKDNQVPNATRACMLNLGGSGTTAASFVIETASEPA